MPASEPRCARRFLDRHFRWRGTEVSRMEAFADAAFALVLALLFLQDAAPRNLVELQTTMKSLVPFALTFVLLALIWVEHHRYFRRYGLCDKATFFGNLLLLFLVAAYAYPLKFLFTYLIVLWFGPIGETTRSTLHAGSDQGDLLTMMQFYACGYGAIYATFAVLYRHALRRRDDLGLDAVERYLTVTSIYESLVMVAFAAASVLLAVLGHGSASGLVFLGIGPVMAVLGWRRGVGVERLVAARAA